jgi:hypothetical protein
MACGAEITLTRYFLFLLLLTSLQVRALLNPGIVHYNTATQVNLQTISMQLEPQYIFYAGLAVAIQPAFSF